MAQPESLLLVHTGNGKGKSSSAFGVMLRGWGRGWRVGVVQFIKSGAWKTGEKKAADALGIEFVEAGDGFTWESDDLDHTADLARHAWARAAAMLASGEYGLLILDEVTYAMTYGWVPVDEVVAALKGRALGTHVVVTGRDCPAEIVEIADTVTDMTPIKHAYDRGIPARKGIEY